MPRLQLARVGGRSTFFFWTFLLFFLPGRHVSLNIKKLGARWYMCLKIENCYLKIFMETHVSEKLRENT